MDRYFRVEKGSIVDGPFPRARLKHATTSIGDGTTDAELAALGWFKQVKVGDVAFDQATHKKTGPVNSVGASTVTSTWTVSPLSAQELQDKQDVTDRDAIRDGLIDTAEILTVLVDALLANSTIAAANFNASTRAKYQSLKQRVDRLRS